MKRYTDYSKAELAKLSEEDVKQLIELECMINGVSELYIKPDLKPVEELPKPDIEVFEVAGIKFTDEDEAMDLLDVDDIDMRKKKILNVTKEDIINLANKIKIDTVFLLGGDKND